MKTKISIAAAFAAAFMLGEAGSASAAPVEATCASPDRDFSITTDPGASCFASGGGNITGNSKNDPIFALLGSDYLLIDKSGGEGSDGVKSDALSGSPSLTSGLSGSFSIDAFGYDSFIIAFKSGGNQNEQTVWAAFSLPDGVTSGTWSITGQNALSHVNLYGKLAETQVVPLPAAGFLLLGGLASIGALGAARRKG